MNIEQIKAKYELKLSELKEEKQWVEKEFNHPRNEDIRQYLVQDLTKLKDKIRLVEGFLEDIAAV